MIHDPCTHALYCMSVLYSYIKHVQHYTSLFLFFFFLTFFWIPGTTRQRQRRRQRIKIRDETR